MTNDEWAMAVARNLFAIRHSSFVISNGSMLFLARVNLMVPKQRSSFSPVVLSRGHLISGVQEKRRRFPLIEQFQIPGRGNRVAISSPTVTFRPRAQEITRPGHGGFQLSDHVSCQVGGLAIV